MARQLTRLSWAEAWVDIFCCSYMGKWSSNGWIVLFFVGCVQCPRGPHRHRLCKPIPAFSPFRCRMIPRTLFSSEHELFRDSVRKFLEQEAVPFHAQW